jgi:DNA-nicking Smr family endonuclease
MKKYPKQTRPIYPNKTNSLKDERAENELWNEFTANVSPLHHRNLRSDVGQPDYSSKNGPPVVLKKEIRLEPLTHREKVDYIVPDFSHGSAAGLDSQSARKIRRGKIQIQARLDLHGMIQTQAHTSLLSFLEYAYTSGKKLVLVITGKGLTQAGEVGVLRKSVPRWLNEQPMKTWIRGFDYASPKDGGAGALYILLRRKR